MPYQVLLGLCFVIFLCVLSNFVGSVIFLSVLSSSIGSSFFLILEVAIQVLLGVCFVIFISVLSSFNVSLFCNISKCPF